MRLSQGSVVDYGKYSMKRLLLILLLSLASSAQADWSLLASNNNRYYYVDYTTILRGYGSNANRTKSAWFKFTEPDRSYTLLRFEFDCVSSQDRILASRVYSPYGDLINSYDDASNWEWITPGSRLEYWKQLICR